MTSPLAPLARNALATCALALAPLAAHAGTPVPDKADVAWMNIATLLVTMMTIPGLALFYGGMVRAKNVLSVLMQVLVIFSLIVVLWAIYGYSIAFGGDGAFFGNLSKIFLHGVTVRSTVATFSRGVVIPELSFVAFQATFAAISCALIVGAFAERIRFTAALLFSVLWFSFDYLPIAHAVWYWAGPDAISDAKSLLTVLAGAGSLWARGTLDFAGGTVVHINAGVAGLVGAWVIGKRIGYGRESMAPHSLVLTMIGASLLWVGWFGFNAGSSLEANAVAALSLANTLLAGAAGTVSWTVGEWIARGRPSLLGAASGVAAGLVAITPACGFVGPMGALIIGLVSGVACLWGVNSLKRLLGADDSLDVFGVHGVGGIVGALLTAIFAAPALGGSGVFDYVTNSVAPDYLIIRQLWIQLQAVLLTVAWSATTTFIAFRLIDRVIGLRVSEEQERRGLDISEHGETFWNV